MKERMVEYDFSTTSIYMRNMYLVEKFKTQDTKID